MAIVANPKKIHPERELTEEETKYILSIEEKDITATLLKDLFARKYDGSDPKYHTNDYFKLPTSRFHTKKEVYTTIGIYIFNVFIVQPNFASLFGYWNKPITADGLDSFEAKLSSALYNDRIIPEQMSDYYSRIQWLGGDRSMMLITSSLTSDILRSPKEIIRKRDELFKAHEKELDPSNKNNAIVGAKIEKELTDMAKAYIKTTEGQDIFNAGAKISIPNHYKNMFISKGNVNDPFTNQTRVNKSNLATGISKEDYLSIAGSGVLGSYMRALNTANSGYVAKTMNQAMQAVHALPRGTDCQSQKTITVHLFPKNRNEYLDRYIVDEKRGLVLLSEEEWPNYVNKDVHMRTPLYCQAPESCYCSVCTGLAPHKVGIENFGLTVSRIGNALLNISLKSFHDSTAKLSSINPDELFIFN